MVVQLFQINCDTLSQSTQTTTVQIGHLQQLRIPSIGILPNLNLLDSKTH